MTLPIPRSIKQHASDNVIVAVDTIERGSSPAGVAALARVPKGQKMAVLRIAKGAEIFAKILEVASGVAIKAEALGYGDAEFVPWQIGATM